LPRDNSSSRYIHKGTARYTRKRASKFHLGGQINDADKTRGNYGNTEADIQKDASSVRRGRISPAAMGNVRHKLIDILVIGLCSAITRNEGFDEMEELGRAREDWFRTF